MIVIAINSFFPGIAAGGPPISVANFVKFLENKYRYEDVTIVTADRDVKDKNPYSSNAIKNVLDSFSCDIFYLSETNYISYILLLLRAKIIIVNSVFHKKYGLLIPTIISLVTRKTVYCFVRGELQSNSISNKRLFKIIFLRLLSFLSTESIIFIYSNAFERKDSYKYENYKNYRIVSNIPSECVQGHNCTRSDMLSLVYLGRIAEDKNLLGLVKCLHFFKNPVEITIYGPISDIGYWKRCMTEIANLPRHIKVSYDGVLGRNALVAKSRLFHYLVCPSISENFGHSISEALHMGLPVICSNGTPWQNLERYGLGYNLSFEGSRLSDKLALYSFSELAQIDRKEQIVRLETYPLIKEIKQQNTALIDEIIGS